ncbi:hypothetical protein HND97_11385 [Vibrio cholerae]|nr:hypothetical protein HND97_11385 [Vibrio cholerae]
MAFPVTIKYCYIFGTTNFMLGSCHFTSDLAINMGNRRTQFSTPKVPIATLASVTRLGCRCKRAKKRALLINDNTSIFKAESFVVNTAYLLTLNEGNTPSPSDANYLEIDQK